MKSAKLLFTCFAMLFLLTACGGSGESLSRDDGSTTDDDDTVTETYTIVMSIVDSDDNLETNLSDGAPLNVNVFVSSSSGAVVSGEVVNYALSQTNIASFNNDTGTALTNSEGIASIQLIVGIESGSGTVTASIADGTFVSGGFTSSGTAEDSPSSIELYANSTQLASSGGDEIELIALVKNQQNVLLPDIAVSFSVDNNASLSDIDSVTGADGTARATLSTSNNKENRTITVTAAAQTLSETLSVDVVGTEVNINGASSVILGDTSPITIVLSDSDGTGISGQTIDLTASSGTLTNATPITSENGQVTVNYVATETGAATIRAVALNASTTFSVTVQEDDFSFSNVPTEGLQLDTSYPLSLQWNKNGSPYAGGSVTVTTSRGEIVGSETIVTDSTGEAEFVIRSAFAGPASISAVGVDADGSEVTARDEVEFIASNVDTIFVDATPDLIGPEGQTSTITALLRDAEGNLVKGKTVNFSLAIDSSGGSISPNTATTDSNGLASTVYTSNAVSADNGITIEAESDGVVSSTTLTIGNRAFDISLGTGSIIESPDNSTYMKEFAIFVTDASGGPIADAELSASVVPTSEGAFRKGFWVWDDDSNIYVILDDNFVSCDNEDSDKDGTLDAGEDLNGDGELTPGNVASISFADSVAVTDEFGQATVQIRYPRQFGAWATVVINVFGQSSGTESSQSQSFTLAVAAADLTNESTPPPNSPYGIGSSCADTL